MKQGRRHSLDVRIAVAAVLAFTSSAGLAQARQVIQVATVAELEAAVLIPDATVKVAPGTYALTQNITLAEGTHLIGSNRMRDTDRDGIPDPIEPPDGFVVAGTETKLVANATALGANVIGGTGSNRVAQLTVEGPVPTRALLANVREVTDCLLDGTPGTLGPNDQCTLQANVLCSACEAEFILRRNVLRDCAAGANYSNNQTTDARIKVLLSGNRFYRNVSGVVTTGGLAAATSDVDVVSIRNLMEANFQGWAATGGTGVHHQIPGVLTGSQGNRVNLYSFGDVFRDNTLYGLLAQASFRRLVPGAGYSEENSDNHVQLTLLGAGFDQDPAPPAPGGLPRGDVALLGGFSSPSAATPAPGTGNVVEFLALGSDVEPDVSADLLLIDSNPAGAGNEVIILGSESSFSFLNDPFDIDAFGVELCEFFSAGCPE